MLLKKTGSWHILFSLDEQSIHVVPLDHHSEPLKLHKREFHEITRSVKNINDAERRKRTV